MAYKASKIPFLRLTSNRGLVQKVCPRPVGDISNITLNWLDNKILVATAEAALPVTRIAVAFRAGARYENKETIGASHMLRVMAGQSTRSSTGFFITRNLQQVGGALTVSSDREIVCYTVETTAMHTEMGLRILQDCLQPAFKPWELSDSEPRIRTQIAAVPPQVQAVELMHKAAFRTGLGNSIYMPEYRVGALSSESLLQYVTSNFTSNRCAVLGVGIDFNSLLGFAKALDLYSFETKPDTATYYGGDVRKETAGDLAHVAVGGQGGALLNQKESLAFGLMAHALGSSAACKRGQMHGNFGDALSSSASDGFIFSALNACYAETGLFGFVISADSEEIGHLVETLVSALKSGTISEENFERGKALLQMAVVDTYTTDGGLLNEMVTQALITKQIVDADSLLSNIDALTLTDVQNAIRKAGTKFSVGAVGNLTNVPYASELDLA